MGRQTNTKLNARIRIGNEIVCGKTTPLTMNEAKRLPEWKLWLESMKKEFTALQEMGVFELVKRKDLPKKLR